MALLVVALGRDEAGLLTLAEWDALIAREVVWFEDPDHPLVERLRASGIKAGPFDDEPAAGASGSALVARPDSSRIVELARAGAEVLSGAPNAPDDLSSAHGASVVRRASARYADLVAVMARLRSEDGCPWDREQTHQSLKVHLLEETYEVLDAIEGGELGDELEEELGDVLLQVVFHSRLADQDGRFDAAGVAARLVAKLVHRHPHVFGSRTVKDAQEVLANWETLKADEKDRTDLFDGIPATLPALLAAYKSQKRATQVGIVLDEAESLERARAALDAVAGPDDVGDALFWMVAIARSRGLDPEAALRASIARFRTAARAAASKR